MGLDLAGDPDWFWRLDHEQRTRVLALVQVEEEERPRVRRGHDVDIEQLMKGAR